MRDKGRFIKGTSGNPGGRPAVVKEVTDLARQHTPEAIETLVAIYRNEETPAQARVAAINSVLDRGHGRPAQSLDMTHKRALDDFSDGELDAVLNAVRSLVADGPTGQTH